MLNVELALVQCAFYTQHSTFNTQHKYKIKYDYISRQSESTSRSS